MQNEDEHTVPHQELLSTVDRRPSIPMGWSLSGSQAQQTKLPYTLVSQRHPNIVVIQVETYHTPSSSIKRPDRSGFPFLRAGNNKMAHDNRASRLCLEKQSGPTCMEEPPEERERERGSERVPSALDGRR